MAFDSSNFEISDLNSLNSENVSDLLDQIIVKLQDLNPELDLKRGVFKDTVAYYHAVLEAAIRTNLDRYQSARSLQKIEEDPTLADPDVVDEVLSNWGIARKSGTQATGSVTIEVSQAQTLTVPAGYVFQSNGKSYVATNSFIARTSEAQVTTVNDRLLIPLNNGNWAFTIEVEATEIGADYKLNAGELITPVRALTGYVTSYATASFTDGTNTETNAELLTQLQNGVSAKTVSNRATMRALVATDARFVTVTNQSIVGYGDPEMTRDQHTIFPISYGGRVDWYIRTQAPIQKETHEVEATLISIEGSSSTWQFSLSKDVSPGFYEVSKIRRVDDSILNDGFVITLDDRGFDLTGEGFIPDIESVEESAYSPFQTATIRFVDTATSVTGLSLGEKRAYLCEISGMPLLKELQDYLASRDVRSYAADVLVKAPIPCFVDVTLDINKIASEPEPNIAGIKAAIVDEINRAGFNGRLDGSLIIDKVHGFLSNETSITNLALLGRIRTPDGFMKYGKSSNALIVPDSFGTMIGSVSSKTVQFFSDTSRVSVNVKTSIPTAS